MYLLCIHIEYVLVHDSIRWDLMWPQSISPTNQCCMTCKGASSCVEAARAALAAPRMGSLATSRTREEPAREAATGPREGAPGRRAGWPRRAELRDTRARPHAPGAGSKPRERERERGGRARRGREERGVSSPHRTAVTTAVLGNRPPRSRQASASALCAAGRAHAGGWASGLQAAALGFGALGCARCGHQGRSRLGLAAGPRGTVAALRGVGWPCGMDRKAPGDGVRAGVGRVH
jgi:hypothetical protein